MESQNVENAFIKFKSLSMTNNEEENNKYEVKDAEEYEGEGEPRNIAELKILLDYIKRNYEIFELEDVKRLKKLFLSWIENRDLTQEEFKIYSDLIKAGDIIRGTSDTEDEVNTEDEDTNEEEDTTDDSNAENSGKENNEEEEM